MLARCLQAWFKVYKNIAINILQYWSQETPDSEGRFALDCSFICSFLPFAEQASVHFDFNFLWQCPRCDNLTWEHLRIKTNQQRMDNEERKRQFAVAVNRPFNYLSIFLYALIPGERWKGTCFYFEDANYVLRWWLKWWQAT